ncbi:GDSL esterase/lipase [Morus notabilis]|uniref:GDSL esterase/lipase n=1 Tax=Morus notabilis TaxID=981085 RepID=W9SAU9_9ROSA|nr:GDSL esterase/lipase At2g40250 [Morus notabilis]EXB96525.1 GDSL esterase/lipase [Morus notabilis]
MERRKTTLFLAIFFSFAFITACARPAPTTTAASNQSPPFAAVFAFGDSTIDSGNNNGLMTIFRGDHPPYGRDFPGHIPTGRFSNGKLATDFLVASLGIKDALPAYLSPSLTEQDLATGVSFASGGSGLDDATTALTGVIDMPRQLQYFDEAMYRLEGNIGRNATQELVRNSIFVISVGTNDVVFNLYRTLNFQHTPSSYQDFLLQRIQAFIQALYKRGARKIGVAGLPPVGCLPLQVTVGSFMPSPHMLHRLCITGQNIDSQTYNSKLQQILSNLQSSLRDSGIVYFDIYDSMMDMITNPAKYGFQNTLQGCCGTGMLEMGPLCVVGLPMCPDPSQLIFWDSMHPTEAAYKAIADQFLQTVRQLH